jgi:hypothetical protein
VRVEVIEETSNGFNITSDTSIGRNTTQQKENSLKTYIVKK